MSTVELNADGPGLTKDTLKTATKEGSSFITLFPYTLPRLQKKKKQQYKVLNLGEVFGLQRWTKYFEIQISVEDDLELYKKLAERVGTDVQFRRQADGVIIIEASDTEQSQKLQELIAAEDPDLPVKQNKSLNACYGTVVVPENIKTGEKEFVECGKKIKQNIVMQGCEIRDVVTYIRPPRGSRRHPLRIAKIKFEGRILPDTVVIGGQQ